MNRWRLVLAGLRHDQAAHLALAAAVAVTTAVLTGALLVGDSVRGSLRDLALARLGAVRFAGVGQRFVPADLAERLARDVHEQSPQAADAEVLPAILLTGSASSPAGRAAGDVQVAAIPGLVDVQAGSCIVDGLLADALGVSAGEDLIVRLPQTAATPAESIFARKARGDVLSGLRVRVAEVRRSGQAARFSLDNTQRDRTRVWMNLGDMQKGVGADGNVNALLVVDPREALPGSDWLQARLEHVTSADDLGLRIEAVGEGASALSSEDSPYLPPAAVGALADRPRINRVLVHLVNEARTVAQAGDQPMAAIHYAVAAGMSQPPGGPLALDEIALNAWAAERLSAEIGSRIELAYYVRAPDGRMVEVGADRRATPMTFRVARIVPMEGLGADPTLTPSYEGLTDADSIADWNPPADLNIDKRLVTDADEAYWDRYRAAPKIFLNLRTAQALWAGPFGELTSIRFPADQASAVRGDLEQSLTASAMGVALRDVRAEQLRSAAGTTDFASLYLGLSIFLVAAAGLLTALQLRLNVERRARQYGLLEAMGYRPAAVRLLALGEALFISFLGVVVGMTGGLGYTAGLLAGLRTWWRPAVGTAALSLHAQPLTLAIAASSSLALALAATWWGLKHLRRRRTVELLAGGAALSLRRPGRRRSRILAAGVLAALATAAGAASAFGAVPEQWGYLLGSAVLLAAMLTGLSAWLRPGRARTSRVHSPLALLRLAWTNATRSPGRSMITVSLLALAAFSLVTVSAMRKSEPASIDDPTGPAGGFAIVGRLSVPVAADLNTVSGRRLAGFDQPNAALWQHARILTLRRRPGQDISCLNLQRPSDPSILGVPVDEFLGRFRFARAVAPADRPWELLRRDADGAVPVVADDETARYILHLAPGETITVRNARGEDVRLKLVATLAGSIFQGDLLMDAETLGARFPEVDRFDTLVVETTPGRRSEALETLRRQLADFGPSIRTSGEVLRQYWEVANTYLATFRTLGALGMLLGSAGLAVVGVRNLYERRAELAMLAALGMGPGRRSVLVLAENAMLLLIGIAIGAAVALVGVLPISQARQSLNAPALLATLSVVVVGGLAVQAVALQTLGRRFRIGDLRRE